MFLISKIADWLLTPVTLLLLSGVLGYVLPSGKKWKRVRIWAFFPIGLALSTMAVPLDLYWAHFLENRFPVPLPEQRQFERLDGIVVLGGAISLGQSVERGHVSLSSAGERVSEILYLHHRFPKAKILYSGGSGDPFRQEIKEAPLARQWLQQSGMEVGEMIFEDQSRNTRENALFSKDILKPEPGQTWLLVTSAVHMPRAMGTFQAVGWEVVPWPVQYQTRTIGFGLRLWGPGRLQTLSDSLHEAAGLLYYRWQGWIPVLLPHSNSIP